MLNEKPLFVIPTDYVESLCGLFNTESNEAMERVTSFAKEAQGKYKSYNQSWWTSYLTQAQIEKVDALVDKLEKNKNPYERLTLIKQLINFSDKEDNTSYDVFFLRELYKTIPGYEYNVLKKNDVLSLFVFELKSAFIKKIDEFIKKHEDEEARQRQKAQEIKDSEQKLQQRAEGILICNSLYRAQLEAKNQQKKTIFYINFEGQWKLALIDFKGKSHFLHVSESLKILLEESRHSIAVKKECIEAAEQFLMRTHLIINPKNKEEEEVSSTFILRHSKEKITLQWISRLNSIDVINFKNYPELQTWLLEHQTPFDDEMMMQLKICLLSVKTTKVINNNLVKKLGKLLKPDVIDFARDRLSLIINPTQNDQELLQQGVASTFVLRVIKNEKKLLWINSLNAITEINLSSYPLFNMWLNKRNFPLGEDEEYQLKSYLLNVNPTNALNASSVKTLETLLAEKFNKIKVSNSSDQNKSKEIKQGIEKSSMTNDSAKKTPQPLSKERYQNLSQLPNFWATKNTNPKPLEPLEPFESDQIKIISSSMNSIIMR